MRVRLLLARLMSCRERHALIRRDADDTIIVERQRAMLTMSLLLHDAITLLIYVIDVAAEAIITMLTMTFLRYCRYAATHYTLPAAAAAAMMPLMPPPPPPLRDAMPLRHAIARQRFSPAMMAP